MYELLVSESFRRRPALYLGKLSILYLRVYLNGFRDSLSNYGIKEENNIYEMTLPSFNDFVSNYCGIPNQTGWELMILEKNQGNEVTSLIDFFFVFDKFFNIEKSEIFYLNLLKLYRKEIKQEQFEFE